MQHNYKEPSYISNYKFISPHDRLYKDCLKNVQWEQEEKPNILHGIVFITCLILLTYTLLLISN